ncbi:MULTISPECIES: hypothetical protein [unclassified Clostridium]|uniref:hypothetical protein n=1 Tax=unclassified Clostridium TaxID=2614128 RepID=UPI0025C56B1F|nr:MULTISPECIES: hypothetical protein [unclassified Clostridium]
MILRIKDVERLLAVEKQIIELLEKRILELSPKQSYEFKWEMNASKKEVSKMLKKLEEKK